MKKKILVTLVCTCLAVSICACGREKDSGDINTTSVGSNSIGTVEEPALEIDEKHTEVSEEVTTTEESVTNKVESTEVAGNSNDINTYEYTE